jgi:DNA-binding response OmpR family regulator
MRLLLVEDDRNLVEELTVFLQDAGYTVDATDSGNDGEFLGDTESFDAVILDLGLPGCPGLEILRRWRQRGNDVPVLVLTARDAWHEKVDGFNTGADDYLGKPFHMEELLARLQALIRRRHGRADAVLAVGQLTLDDDTRSLKKESGKNISLTATEYRLLEYLMNNPGVIVTKTRILDHVWGDASEEDENLVEVYIRRLRHKVGREYIETRRGQGYVFRVDPCDH